MIAKSKRAWAVVKKKNPVINVNDIFPDKEVSILEDEKLIKVEIKEIEK